jgi:hypothetical protein
MSMLDTSSSERKETITAHLAQEHTLVTQQLELLDKTQESTSTESEAGDNQPGHGKNGTRELLSTDIAQVTNNQPSTTEPSKTAVPGLERPMFMLDTSSSERKETITAPHAQEHTLDTQLLELVTKTQRSILIES